MQKMWWWSNGMCQPFLLAIDQQHAILFGVKDTSCGGLEDMIEMGSYKDKNNIGHRNHLSAFMIKCV